jgi:hypothetical protein
MKKWKDLSKKYPDYLKEKIFNTQPRLSALLKIEQYLREQNPKLLNGEILLRYIEKNKLRNKFKEWKGKELTGSESQVFNDFYNLDDH